MRASISTGENCGTMLVPAAEQEFDSLPIVMLAGYNDQDTLMVSVSVHGRSEDRKPTVADFRMTYPEFDQWVDDLIEQREDKRELIARGSIPIRR